MLQTRVLRENTRPPTTSGSEVKVHGQSSKNYRYEKLQAMRDYSVRRNENLQIAGFHVLQTLKWDMAQTQRKPNDVVGDFWVVESFKVNLSTTPHVRAGSRR